MHCRQVQVSVIFEMHYRGSVILYSGEHILYYSREGILYRDSTDIRMVY